MYVGYMRMALIISIITVFRWTTPCSSSLVWPLLSPSPSPSLLSPSPSSSSLPSSCGQHLVQHLEPSKPFFALTILAIKIMIITSVLIITSWQHHPYQSIRIFHYHDPQVDNTLFNISYPATLVAGQIGFSLHEESVRP